MEDYWVLIIFACTIFVIILKVVQWVEEFITKMFQKNPEVANEKFSDVLEMNKNTKLKLEATEKKVEEIAKSVSEYE